MKYIKERMNVLYKEYNYFSAKYIDIPKSELTNEMCVKIMAECDKITLEVIEMQKMCDHIESFKTNVKYCSVCSKRIKFDIE